MEYWNEGSRTFAFWDDEEYFYPATVYPVWLRVIVTFIIPIAVATTIPLQALRGELGPGQIFLFIVISIVSFWVATKVWKLGLKRYSGASS